MIKFIKSLFRPKAVAYTIAVSDSSGFVRWKGLRTKGNVYQKWQDYLTFKTRCYTQVGPDWVYSEGHHKRNSKGVILTFDKHPIWFKRWVRGNGVGQYRTAFDPDQKNR